MKKQAILTDGAPSPVGAYSQGLRVGDFVYVSGQVGRHPVTGELADGIKAQTARTLENVLAILQAGGATFEDVVKSTVHLKDMNDFALFNEEYDRYFPDPKPVRTTVGSYLPKALVEIDVVAYAPIQK
ncbi:2-iminobutanoate/2-iminopropanoate deaminase [Paenibacillus allorhizoplanae]|uniref:2-iminobutanoate/2-iminopropanoate deaminase n=1 Tax=Paenibacillus allorhizoplanae TaxID=2905648 RepID=A0ABN8H550_9BACL|nr:Rid family detoxifying hydrolase [Paenibacillus allorhizoplanae]CAH1221437.1 2-iminobutanoate/2-iminopropanoate deaminase [Paenibacillus allorhizoplanae]